MRERSPIMPINFIMLYLGVAFLKAAVAIILAGIPDIGVF